MAYSAFDLRGKVALITGGNSGIGLGMAEALAASGCDIALWGTNAAKNEAACKRLAASGVRVESFACDVGDEAAVEETFTRTLQAMGRVDGCFANAGVAGRAPSFLEMSAEEWRRVLRVNLDGAFHTFRAAARQMVAQGSGGTLVGTASLAAIEGQARGEHYASTKGAMISMVRALAVEFARYKITANAILPGWIETDMTERWFANETFRDKVLPRVPVRRWGGAADFGGIAVYLMSDASRYHTGDTFVIDGGYSIF